MHLRVKILLIIVAGFTLITGCEKDDNDFPLDIDFNMNPIEANTCDTILFQVGSVSENTIKETLFYRWDWNSDSIWDTQFSALSKYQYRYFESGNYTITMQYVDGKGKSRSFSKNLDIAQGFSAPRPKFTISPETGNYFQEFVFDASSTKDDEDSLNVLLFKWDFDGDGHWDTNFEPNPIAVKKYKTLGSFYPELEVKDPSNKVASYSQRLEIHKTDTLIHVNVEWPQKKYLVGDTIVFDATESYYELNPIKEYQISWKVPNNPEWSVPDDNKIFSYIVNQEGINKIACKVILNTSLLENIGYIEIIAGAENLPPNPSFEVAIPYGNTSSQFYFNCWSSSDDNIPPSQLFLRWDWNNDGVWDTPFSKEKEYYHQYSEPGRYEFALQAKDNFDKTAITYGEIRVSSYSNPTSFFKDQRDHQLYGTVKIGDQWWMAENLRYEVPGKTESGLFTTRCLNEDNDWCESVGKLYHVASIVEDHFDNKFIDVCPDGWRLPTKTDWEKLFDELGGTDQAKNLIFGKSADFNGIFLGYGSFLIVLERGVWDTIYTFHDTFESMYLPSSSLPRDPGNVRSDIFMIHINRFTEELWTGYNSLNYYVPVRCIKE